MEIEPVPLCAFMWWVSGLGLCLPLVYLRNGFDNVLQLIVCTCLGPLLLIPIGWHLWVNWRTKKYWEEKERRWSYED